MKKALSLILCCAFIISIFSGCTKNVNSSQPAVTMPAETVPTESAPIVEATVAEDGTPVFRSLDDPALLNYMEDDLYASLENQFSSDDYIVEGVSAIYISEEYLSELSYNSAENIFFGYSLSELDDQFDGKRYIFTLGDDGSTVVQEINALYDDTYNQVLKNIAIGTGVILLCVTVTVATAGLGAPATVTAVFATAAKAGTAAAVGGGLLSAATEGIVKGYETGDMDEAMKAAALGGSNDFKWGAIVGSFSGGITKAHKIHKIISDPNSPNYRISERLAKELYGGTEQKSFLARKSVSSATPDATRPDLWRKFRGHWEAIEVKNYDLANSNSFNHLKHELHRQVSSRVTNLPEGATQRIVLDVRNRNFSSKFLKSKISDIQSFLDDIYLDIPIDIMR